ncbi:hypothetical protein FTUN_2515 [Frigoriglobus tundricola]|uniref:Uncharacterized protein n=1 Tax=Frigoriglobus tundricola TaxID=2774151 RepID=A0A6M5YLM0_9BACT|nr:hypothetical protein FTUN_2515 [Frigoriglobus tundricola]
MLLVLVPTLVTPGVAPFDAAVIPVTNSSAKVPGFVVVPGTEVPELKVTPVTTSAPPAGATDCE